MNRAFFHTSLLLIAAFLVVGCVAFRAQMVGAQVSDALPAGTPLLKVEAYLEQHEYEYTYFDRTNQIVARLRNIQSDSLVQEDTALTFQFDQNQRLLNIKALPANSSP